LARAGAVVKADLSAEMVSEFPELQGLMGRSYAQAAALSGAIAAAVQDHYAPLGPSDDVPTAPVSVAVALADKLDTLTGFWAIDEKPTGSKDPYALRRAALGVIRLVLDNGLTLKLTEALALGDAQSKFQMMLVQSRAEEDPPATDDLIAKGASGIFDTGAVSDETRDLLSFFHDRLKVYLKDQGIRHDVIDACIAMPGNDDLALLVKRARALSDTLATDDGENLLQGFKRANNILTQAEQKDGVEYSYGADPKFAEDPAEKALFAALDQAEAQMKPAMAAQDFTTAMAAMAGLRGPIDGFFTAVQVNADQQVLRRNRLNLLSRIRTICLSVADLTKVEGQS